MYERGAELRLRASLFEVMSMLNFENLSKARFAGVGKYDIPTIAPTDYDSAEWIGFNQAKGQPTNGKGRGIHFFLDDYQFNVLWSRIDTYISLFQRYDYVLSPDFSLFTDMPTALQVYNHYRKHWIAAYLQPFGVKVIPTIAWSDENSLEWCFDGEPVGAAVAISTVGTQRYTDSRRLFLLGYEKMLKTLRPTKILCYGKAPDEIKEDIIDIGCFYDRFTERRVRE